ncbi:MAG: hypothetical protein M1505_02470 [Patescibacteria group bacterium]|nr:hypothetical protein [Patescibacteria group bacterium]MCL5258064.1 hypothetical protein [Patescibacteria group bacterium]
MLINQKSIRANSGEKKEIDQNRGQNQDIGQFKIQFRNFLGCGCCYGVENKVRFFKFCHKHKEIFPDSDSMEEFSEFFEELISTAKTIYFHRLVYQFADGEKIN